jgi:autotransporter translocation and assembly factor TamB
MNKIHLMLVICLVAVVSISAAIADDSSETADRLKECAKIVEQAARIACYEALGKETLAEESNADTAAAAGKADSSMAVAATGTAAAAETLPASSPPTNVPIDGNRPPEEYRVVVSSCRINNAGEIYLTLDNGEVWKRTGGQHVRESECSFSATLRKDFFGYKMFIDDDQGTVRVKRVK